MLDGLNQCKLNPPTKVEKMRKFLQPVVPQQSMESWKPSITRFSVFKMASHSLRYAKCAERLLAQGGINFRIGEIR